MKSARQILDALCLTTTPTADQKDIELKVRNGYGSVSAEEQETPETQRAKLTSIQNKIRAILNFAEGQGVLVQHIHNIGCEHPFNKEAKTSPADVVRACEEVYKNEFLLKGYELFHQNVASINQDIQDLDGYLRKKPADQSKEIQSAFNQLKTDFTAYRKTKFTFVHNRDKVNLDGLMEAYKEYNERVVSQVIACKEQGIKAVQDKKAADKTATATETQSQGMGCR